MSINAALWEQVKRHEQGLAPGGPQALIAVVLILNDPSSRARIEERIAVWGAGEVLSANSGQRLSLQVPACRVPELAFLPGVQQAEPLSAKSAKTPKAKPRWLPLAAMFCAGVMLAAAGLFVYQQFWPIGPGQPAPVVNPAQPDPIQQPDGSQTQLAMDSAEPGRKDEAAPQVEQPSDLDKAPFYAESELDIPVRSGAAPQKSSEKATSAQDETKLALAKKTETATKESAAPPALPDSTPPAAPQAKAEAEAAAPAAAKAAIVKSSAEPKIDAQEGRAKKILETEPSPKSNYDVPERPADRAETEEWKSRKPGPIPLPFPLPWPKQEPNAAKPEPEGQTAGNQTKQKAAKPAEKADAVSVAKQQPVREPEAKSSAPAELRAAVDELYRQGLDAYQVGDLDKAVVLFERAVRLDDTRLGLRRTLAWALFEQGSLIQARKHFLIILRENPGDEEAKSALELLLSATADQ